MKIIFLLPIFLLLMSCATKVTPQGNQTRQIDESWKKSCKHLGNEKTYSTFKLGAKGNYLNVQNNIKNITADKGGNAYFVNDFSSDGLGHYGAVFEVYDCPSEKYKIPAKYEELEKLQELYEKGILTSDEYNIEKGKILNSHD